MTERWIPQVGDHVFSVHEFILNTHDRDGKIPGYSRHGYEIVESEVKEPYRWRKCDGVKSVAKVRMIGNNANNCFYWKKTEYGKKVFPTFEDAIPYADYLTDYYEAHFRYKEEEQCFRHWRNEHGLST